VYILEGHLLNGDSVYIIQLAFLENLISNFSNEYHKEKITPLQIIAVRHYQYTVRHKWSASLNISK